MTNIFVAKLDFGVSDEALKLLFENYGTVVKCHIAKDRETGKPRGFAFVEMGTAEEAQEAIRALDNYEINGRNMVVKLKIEVVTNHVHQALLEAVKEASTEILDHQDKIVRIHDLLKQMILEHLSLQKMMILLHLHLEKRHPNVVKAKRKSLEKAQQIIAKLRCLPIRKVVKSLV